MTRNATKDEIKQSYRALSRVYHPDKGGDAQKFAPISQAYNVFTNNTKREEYNLYIVSRRGRRSVRSLQNHWYTLENRQSPKEPLPHLGGRTTLCFHSTST